MNWYTKNNRNGIVENLVQVSWNQSGFCHFSPGAGHLTPKKCLRRGHLTKERDRMVGNLTKKRVSPGRGDMSTIGFDSYITCMYVTSQFMASGRLDQKWLKRVKKKRFAWEHIQSKTLRGGLWCIGHRFMGGWVRNFWDCCIYWPW